MDKELKAKWVAALRSGEYKQGKTFLRREDNSYCCLGVLLDVAGVDRKKWDGMCITPFKGGVGNEYLDSCDASPLANMNDEGKPFTEIADYIEENL